MYQSHFRKSNVIRDSFFKESNFKETITPPITKYVKKIWVDKASNIISSLEQKELPTITIDNIVKVPSGITRITNFEKPTFENWVLAYYNYLQFMYIEILARYHDIKKISFDDFCKFIYKHSSGYITPFA